MYTDAETMSWIVYWGTLTLILLFTYWYMSHPPILEAEFLVSTGEAIGEGSAICSVKGRRRHMEDTYAVQRDLLSNGLLSYYGVFDGHGGNKASAYAANRLHVEVRKELSQLSPGLMEAQLSDILSAITRAFKNLDKRFLTQARRRGWPDGTTAIVAFILGSRPSLENDDSQQKHSIKSRAQLYVANVGDSRCILVRGDKAIALSQDQKPNRPDEQTRIEANGGRVIHMGT